MKLGPYFQQTFLTSRSTKPQLTFCKTMNAKTMTVQDVLLRDGPSVYGARILRPFIVE